MTRRRERTAHATGAAVLGATAIALTGSHVTDSQEPHLRLLPPVAAQLESATYLTGASGTGIGGPVGAGGLGMGRSVIIPGSSFAPMNKASVSHTVKSGDSVWALAQKHGTTVQRIIDANGLSSNALIRVGQVLTIPGKGSSPAKPPASTAKRPAKPSTPAGASTHRVVSGDTLSAIASRYGTTTAKLASANKLTNPNLIRVGQVLTLPGSNSSTPAKPATPPPSSPSTPQAPSKPSTQTATYTVKSGDSVWAIAQTYNSTVSAILKANGLSSDAVIQVGQKLSIPGATGSAVEAGPKTPSNACQNVVPNTFLHYTYSDDVVSAANANKCTLDAMNVPSQSAMQELVRSTALAMGVDPVLALAVAFQESGFNQRAVSPANAIGTMQVIPSSGDWAGQMLGRSINLLDPNDNVAAGVAILRQLQRTFPDNLDYAIGSYYQGSGSVSQYGLASDTRAYVNAVKAHMSRFR